MRRRWPIAMTAASLASGMLYSLWWAPVVRHHEYWLAPGDLWGTFRLAQQLDYSSIRDLVLNGSAYLTFPVIVILLAPVALLTHALHLHAPPTRAMLIFLHTASVNQALHHPGAWILVGPAEVLIASSALFALDALAERLEVPGRRRGALCVLEAAALWQVDVIWGHPEDALAVALALYALIAASNQRWTLCGWLFGIALITQPLVLLALPVLLAFAPGGSRLSLTLRSAIPPLLARIVPVIANPHQAITWLANQPNYPLIDHPTPWVALAPHLGPGVVGAGPGRMVALLAAAGVGVLALRRRDDLLAITWLFAVALALRCFFEAVMDPFYIWPAIAIGIVASAAQPKAWRLGATAMAGGGATVFSFWHLAPWPWWTTLGAILIAVIAFARPKWRRYASEPRPNRSGL